MACTPLNRHGDRMTVGCLGPKGETGGGGSWLAPKYFFLSFFLSDIGPSHAIFYIMDLVNNAWKSPHTVEAPS